MGTMAGANDRLNCTEQFELREQMVRPTLDARATLKDSETSLTSIDKRISQLIETVMACQSAPVDDDLVSKLIPEIELIISDSLLSFESTEEEDQQAQLLTDKSLQIVQILDSNLVKLICHHIQINDDDEKTVSLSTICGKYFNQVLQLLSSQCDKLQDTQADCDDRMANVVKLMNVDLRFILLLPILKQLGKLAVLERSTVDDVMQNACKLLFKNETEKNSKRFGLLIKSVLELLNEQCTGTELDETPSFVTNFHDEFVNWIKRKSSDAAQEQEVLPYLLIYCEYNFVPDTHPSQTATKESRVQKSGTGMTLLQLKNVANEHYLKIIRLSLTDTNLLRRKQGIFILKSIISFIRLKADLFFSQQYEVLENAIQNIPATRDIQILRVSQSFDQFVLFWSTFFELFEILDEKQIHIIEPCLKKLEVFENGTYEGRCMLPWYCTLLHKMCHHDNRFIANQGIMRFLNSAPRFITPEDKNVIEISMEFIETTVLPIVKEKVGWLFRSGQEYFSCTKQLGRLLALMDSNMFNTTEFLMEFLVKSCEFKVMSPNSLFFLTCTLCHAILHENIKSKSTTTEKPSNKSSEDLTLLESLIDCIGYFNEYIRKGLPTMDKFLKVETQHQMMDIFCTLIKEAMIQGIEFIMPTSKIDRSQQQVLMSSILRFISSIDYTLFSGNPNLLQVCQQISKFMFRNDEDFNFRKRCEALNSVEICGFMRFYFSKVCQDFELMSTQVTVQHHPYEMFAQLLSFGSSTFFCDSLSDFLKCSLHRQYGNENQDTSQVQHCWNLLIKLFLKCLLLQEAGNAVESTPTSFEMHINSSITLLDIIVKTLPLAVIQHLNFEDETEELQSFLIAMREGLKWSDDIYMDKIQFRFFHIFAKLNQIYGLPIVPAFHISNFLDAFKNTDINSVTDIELSSAFKSEFQEQRLAALKQVLFVNPKKDVIKLLAAKSTSFCWWASLLELVDKSGLNGIIPILDFASGLLSFQSTSSSETDAKILKFAEMSWKSVFEMRKTEAFWIGFEKYIDFIFEPYFSSTGILENMSIEIFERSERITGLSLVLLTKIATLEVQDIIKRNETCLQHILQICTEATFFGPRMLENKKPTFEIWNYLVHIQSREMETNDTNDYSNLHGRQVSLTQSNFDANSKTRILGLEVIVKILNYFKSTNSNCSNILNQIVTQLLDRNDQESRAKKRYFGNSTTHRIKQRIAQALVVLQPYFDENLARNVNAHILKSLAGDNPQPSVRYLMEWIVARNLISFPTAETFASFFSTSKECSSTRIGFGAYFSTICLHTVSGMQSLNACATFCREAFPALSVFVMGHHSTVRPYAQICFRRVYKHLRELAPEEEILSKYEMVYSSLELHLHGSGEINSYMYQKVENNFYLKLFDPVKHYRPRTIFIELPKLSNVSEDEFPQLKDLVALTDFMPCREDTMDLIAPSYCDLDKSAWHLGTILRDGREMGDEERSNMEQPENPEQDSSNVYQKKINPWKYLPISQDITDFSEELQSKKKNCAEDGLILVASLLEKLPNLGGLCRTCEIFGVSKYVISSFGYLTDQTFQNLSVSSEKWVNILEVPQNTLREFLATYSSKGYKILGIEQVSESVPLNSFKFPKKSVLLLGHEKFGIPPELLQVVDQCLEIPQVGVTRSLNVHVTGALCIWQYAAQHSLH